MPLAPGLYLFLFFVFTLVDLDAHLRQPDCVRRLFHSRQHRLLVQVSIATDKISWKDCLHMSGENETMGADVYHARVVMIVMISI